MGRGLPKRPINIFVSGGVDAKTDPKLLTGGAVLRADECYYDKVGALTKCNALTSLSQLWTGRTDGGSINNVKELFQAPGGKPLVIASGTAGTLAPYRALFQYSDAESKWVLNERAPTPMPSVVTSLDNVDSSQSDQRSPDCCVAGNQGTLVVLSVWSNIAGLGPWFTVAPKGGPYTTKTDLRTGTAATPVGDLSRAVGSGKYACVVWVDNTQALRVMIQDTSNLNRSMAACQFVLAAAAVANGSNASVEVMKRPGASTILVAYTAVAGGVSLLEFDPSTGGVVAGPTNVAAADVGNGEGGLALLDDQLATGFYWLATAGLTAGVVVRKLTTAFAVSATTTVDASATTNVKHITGYTTGAATFNVFWDVDATPTQNMLIKKGTSVPAVTTWQRGAGLLSKAWKHDGLYYTVVSYMSTQQNTNVVLAHYNNSAPQPAGVMLPNQAGGRAAGDGWSVGRLASVNAFGAQWVCAVTRKIRLVLYGGYEPIRGVSLAYMDMGSALRRPKELGGVLYIPGGILTAYDGIGCNYAAPVIYPEAPTVTTAGAGSMTPGGQYQWLIVYRTADVSGRITRSAASQPTTLTIAAADGAASVVFPAARLATFLGDPDQVLFGSQVVGEVYRAGPASAGASQYNKVGETPCGSTTADTVSFFDSLSDAAAAAGEALYDTGGVLDNFCPPSSNLMECWNGRVFLVDPEYPTRIWFSKQSRPGQGIAFNPLLTLLCEGDGFGPVTAIAGMDRYLIVFKRGAILAFTGDGPNDANQGSFSNPILVSTTVGTIDPGSVVLTPDGLMFNDFRSGVWTLTRGLSLDPSGFPIANAGAASYLTVPDATLFPSLNQVRFLITGTAQWAVWHMLLKKWTLIAATGATGALAVNSTAQSLAGSWWQVSGASGLIQYEDPTSGNKDTAHAQEVDFPPSSLAGISGFELVYELQLNGVLLNVTGSLEVDIDYDEESTYAETHTINLAALTVFNFAVPLNRRKCRSIAIQLFALSPAVSFSLTSLRVLCAIKGRGMYPMPISQSFT